MDNAGSGNLLSRNRTVTSKDYPKAVKSKVRYQLVTRSSRHGTVFGVWDAELGSEYLVSLDQADALAEIKRRLEQDALTEKWQWRGKSASQLAEEAKKLKQSGQPPRRP